MFKVKIKININGSTQNYIGIKKDNTIIYNNKAEKVIIYLKDELKLIKENDDFKILLIFNDKEKTKGLIILKKENLFLNINIHTNKLKVSDKIILIDYFILETEEKIIYECIYEEV